MMYALPVLLWIDKGILPGNVLGVVRARDVRGGEVYRIRSLGRGMKFLCSSSITQLFGGCQLCRLHRGEKVTVFESGGKLCLLDGHLVGDATRRDLL